MIDFYGVADKTTQKHFRRELAKAVECTRRTARWRAILGSSVAGDPHRDIFLAIEFFQKLLYFTGTCDKYVKLRFMCYCTIKANVLTELSQERVTVLTVHTGNTSSC